MTDRPTASAALADDLYELTRYAAEKGYDTSHGFLGGVWGYGAHIDNDVFEMHPFWWGDCECGHEDAQWAWEEANPHLKTCYQTELIRRIDAAGTSGDIPEKLAAEWKLPRWGAFVHCTCGQQERYAAWNQDNDHDPACPTVRPNFRHKPTGFEVRWYKYIGRDMNYSEPLDAQRWAAMFDECVAAISGSS